MVVAGLLSATASAFLAVGEMAVDEMFFKKVKDEEPSPAAFVQDVRQEFGWQ